MSDLRKTRDCKAGSRILWDQLDEISTLGDIHKPKLDAYFRAVEKDVKADQNICGQTVTNLYWRDQIKEDKGMSDSQKPTRYWVPEDYLFSDAAHSMKHSQNRRQVG